MFTSPGPPRGHSHGSRRGRKPKPRGSNRRKRGLFPGLPWHKPSQQCWSRAMGGRMGDYRRKGRQRSRRCGWEKRGETRPGSKSTWKLPRSQVITLEKHRRHSGGGGQGPLNQGRAKGASSGTRSPQWGNIIFIHTNIHTCVTLPNTKKSCEEQL